MSHDIEQEQRGFIPREALWDDPVAARAEIERLFSALCVIRSYPEQARELADAAVTRRSPFDWSRHVHCDGDPIECAVEAMQGEFAEAVRQRDRYRDFAEQAALTDTTDSRQMDTLGPRALRPKSP